MLARGRARLWIPFLLPAAALHLVLFLVPAALTVYFAFTRWSGILIDLRFAGLDNFAHAVSDPLFFNALKNTFKYMLIGGFLLFPLALLIAWALRQGARGSALMSYLVFAPAVTSTVVIAVLWKFIYSPDSGLLKATLEAVGLGDLVRPWLGDTATALIAITVAAVWYSLGLWVLLISSGMDRIPREVMEAAYIDGAGEWTAFRAVMLPLLWPVLAILIVLWVIGSLQAFGFVYIMSGGSLGSGGPLGSTEVASTYIYGQAFESYHIAYATALTVVLGMAIAISSFVTRRVTRSEEYEY